MELISVIIPTYNRAQFIGETLDSVLAQTYENWECIVVDDGSNDNTVEIVQAYSKKDNRIELYHRPSKKPKGASSCRNFGFEKSKGMYVQYLDSDDILDKSKIFNQVEILKKRSIYSTATCKWGYFLDHSNLMLRFKYQFNTYKSFNKGIDLLNTFGLYNEFFPPHVYLIPRKTIEKAGIWNENLTNNDDSEFLTRVILNSDSIEFSPNAKVYYRFGNENKLSTLDNKKKILSAIASWKLIEEYLNIRFLRNSFYVNNMKFILYEIIKDSFPELIEDNLEFFDGRKDYTNLYYKCIKKLKSRFKFNL